MRKDRRWERGRRIGLPDLGDTLHNNINEWFFDEENRYVLDTLQTLVKGRKPSVKLQEAQSGPFAGLTMFFVVSCDFGYENFLFFSNNELNYLLKYDI